MKPIAPPSDGSESIWLITYTYIHQFTYKCLITCVVQELLINLLTQTHSATLLSYIFTNQINHIIMYILRRGLDFRIAPNRVILHTALWLCVLVFYTAKDRKSVV